MSISADHTSIEVYKAAEVDRTITQAEYLRVNPIDSTSPALITIGRRIVLETNATDSFLYPKDSYVLIEGTIVKSDGTAYAAADDIGLTHNGIMHCLSEVEYLINDRQVERLGNVGQATTMLGLLKYSQDFAISQGESQVWVKDTLDQATGDATTLANNTGHAFRKQIAQGFNFSVAVPLNHILGFADSYDKVVYGAKHTLVLTRGSNTRALMRAAAVANDGSVSFSSVTWFVPKVVLNPVVQKRLLSGVVSKASVQLALMSRECNAYPLSQTTEQYIELGSRDIQEMPRYVIVGFQPNQADQTANGSVFNTINLEDIGVEIGSVKFPLEAYNLDFANGKVARIHREATKFCTKYYGIDELVSQSFLSLREYKKLYPIFVIDTSHHESQDRSGNVQVRLRIRVKSPATTSIAVGTQAFVLTIGEKVLTLESDGSRFNRLV